MPRKSIFRFSLRSPRPESKATPAPLVPDIDEVSLPPDPEARYIPRQWAPNRLQTLYVTPSEQNLYLAAMAQLDRAPPPLPLWSDPAPTLPAVPHQAPMDPTPPSVKSPPRVESRLPGMSSKLVMSPGMPVQGLSVREEFRAVPGASSNRPGEHALLALSDDSQLRFHNFPIDVLVAVDEALTEAWPRGRRSAHPALTDLQKKAREESGPYTWIVVLKGKVWRQAGSSELELILKLLTALSIHGWTLVDRMQAAGVKYDNHNLLFAHSPEIQAMPPTYFALSIPLPDRISLISPPPKATPIIISSVREAIESQTAGSKRKARRGGHKVGGDRTSIASGKKGVEWDAWKGNIRLEGWVHAGVYRFWLGGMRRWLGNGVKWRVVEKLHPTLILTLINSLSAQHFTLLTSLPLLPLVKGRDILIFASQPSSGLTYRDTWKTQPSASGSTTRSESPVLVNTADAQVRPGSRIPAELHSPAGPPAGARQDAAGVMAEERRQAATLKSNSPSAQTSPIRPRHASLIPAARDPSPNHPIENVQHGQNASSNPQPLPLTPATVSSPRQRNIPVKKASLRRDRTSSQPASRSNSLKRNDAPPSSHQRFASLDAGRPGTEEFSAARPDNVHITSRHGIGSDYSAPGTPGPDAEWTMVESPQKDGDGLGLSMYAPQSATQAAAGAAEHGTTRTPGWSGVEARMPPPLPPRSHQRVPQPVITPINPATNQPDLSHSYGLIHAPLDVHPPRPSFDSERSIYQDAPTHTQDPRPLPPTPRYAHIGPTGLRTDSERDAHSVPRQLSIANPTPPPTIPLQQSIMATLDIPLSQPTSPMRGRDAMVDVGHGTGAESMRGSVGYMPSLASQSVLGLTPALSEGPILAAWDEVKPTPGGGPAGGGVPMPMAAPQAGSGMAGQEKSPDRKGKGREAVRNMFGFGHHGGKAGDELGVGNGAAVGNGVGSARTKISMGA